MIDKAIVINIPCVSDSVGSLNISDELLTCTLVKSELGSFVDALLKKRAESKHTEDEISDIYADAIPIYLEGKILRKELSVFVRRIFYLVGSHLVAALGFDMCVCKLKHLLQYTLQKSSSLKDACFRLHMSSKYKLISEMCKYIFFDYSEYIDKSVEKIERPYVSASSNKGNKSSDIQRHKESCPTEKSIALYKNNILNSLNKTSLSERDIKDTSEVMCVLKMLNTMHKYPTKRFITTPRPSYLPQFVVSTEYVGFLKILAKLLFLNFNTDESRLLPWSYVKLNSIISELFEAGYSRGVIAKKLGIIETDLGVYWGNIQKGTAQQLENLEINQDVQELEIANIEDTDEWARAILLRKMILSKQGIGLNCGDEVDIKVVNKMKTALLQNSIQLRVLKAESKKQGVQINELTELVNSLIQRYEVKSNKSGKATMRFVNDHFDLKL